MSVQNVFVLFPHDLYHDISYLADHKVILVEHPKFFDRSIKKYGSMKLNILKPVYHRATMKKYYDFLRKKSITVKYVELTENWIKQTKKYLGKNSKLSFFDPTDRDIERELVKSFEEYDIIDSPRFILTYEDLEKSMKQDQMNAIVTKPSNQEKMKIYIKHRKQNLHKMEPIPVCSMEKFK